MTLWKFHCEENHFPGMWQRWFLNQCVAVGWAKVKGYPLEGKTGDPGWRRVRGALKRIEVGDHVVVSLTGHRVGRVGEVTKKAIGDDSWDPLVPPSLDPPHGEIGRRVFVRWDMMCGPQSRDHVVLLPAGKRLSNGELRPTIAEIRSTTLGALKEVMNNPQNWVGLWTSFKYESSLSDYIGQLPHRLEDGLLPHPDKKVREMVFRDRTRSDVVLIDRDLRSVIVECKQGTPTLSDIRQLRGYIKKLFNETGKPARGILVHGGSRKLAFDIAEAATQEPRIELVRYTVDIDFETCA